MLQQSKDVAVMATLKRAPSELSSYQRKVFKVGSRSGESDIFLFACSSRCPSPVMPEPQSSTTRLPPQIDDHMGIAISGLTADGRILCRYMRNECLNHR